MSRDKNNKNDDDDDDEEAAEQTPRPNVSTAMLLCFFFLSFSLSPNVLRLNEYLSIRFYVQ